MIKIDIQKMSYLVLALVILVMFPSNDIHADIGQGKKEVRSVSSSIHKVADVQSLFSRFNESLDAYEGKKSECDAIIDPNEKEKCLLTAKDILEQAKDILAQLNQQANSIESEIAINKKKVDQNFSEKLDRLLTEVVRMRKEANARMQPNI